MNPQSNNRMETREMAQARVRSVRRSRIRRLFKVLNVPMRLLLRLPFDTPLSRHLMLLSCNGRKTGERYVQPVSYVRDGDMLLTPGGGRWKLNMREGHAIQVRLRARDVLLQPEIVADVDEIDRLLRRMISLNRRVASFVPLKGADGRIDRSKLEAAVHYGFKIIRWRFDQPPMQQDSREAGEPQ